MANEEGFDLVEVNANTIANYTSTNSTFNIDAILSKIKVGLDR
jgi:hypothetical protein